jgi:F1F0 ATPase subunit 2
VNDLLGLSLSFIAGLALGLFYFAGLWWTVQHLANSRSPVLLSMGSFALRALVALAVFYLVFQGEWPRLVFCLLGFLIMRMVLVFRLHPSSK